MSPKEAKRQFNIQQWTRVIQERAASGMKVKEYCKQNNISRDAYFYWQHIIRNETVNQSKNNKQEIVEINFSANEYAAANNADNSFNAHYHNSSDLELWANGVTMYVTNETSSELLARTLEVIRHIK